MELARNTYGMFYDMLLDWPMGTIISILFAALMAMLIGLVGYGLFYLIDSSFLISSRGAGRIIEKEFTPAHTSTLLIYNAALKTSTPQIIDYPDDWSLLIELQDKQGSASVDQETFNALAEGSYATVEYVIGRISGGIYIKNVLLRH